MVALAGVSGETETWPEARPGRTAGARRRPRIWRGIVLGLAALFFGLPLYAALRFSLETTSGTGWTFTWIRSLPSQQGFSAAFWLSVRLAIVTTVITLVLMVPTAVYVHLRFPSLRRLFDGITILPIVIPPVVLIVGVLQVAPAQLKATPYLLALEYAVLAMPFAYRALDAGLRAMDLKTLMEASRSLGGRWFSSLMRVVVPNLRTAILSATVLTVALVLGEFTMASLDQYQTFPAWIVLFEANNAHVSTAASFLARFVTWGVLILISTLGGRRERSSATKEG